MTRVSAAIAQHGPLLLSVQKHASTTASNFTATQVTGGLSGFAVLVLLVFGYFLYKHEYTSILAAIVFFLLGVSGAGLIGSLVLGLVNSGAKILGG